MFDLYFVTDFAQRPKYCSICAKIQQSAVLLSAKWVGMREFPDEAGFFLFAARTNSKQYCLRIRQLAETSCIAWADKKK